MMEMFPTWDFYQRGVLAKNELGEPPSRGMDQDDVGESFDESRYGTDWLKYWE